MALTRRALKAMGIEDEKIDEIISMHTDTVDGLKDQVKTYEADAKKLPTVQKELDELKAELPDKWEYYIDRLSTHIASKGTKYRSHAATIYKWAQEDEAKKPPKKGIPDYTFKEGESL